MASHQSASLPASGDGGQGEATSGLDETMRDIREQAA
jgi:hypothetical protein